MAARAVPPLRPSVTPLHGLFKWVRIMSPYRYNLGSQERKTYAKTSKYSKRMWKLREGLIARNADRQKKRLNWRGRKKEATREMELEKGSIYSNNLLGKGGNTTAHRATVRALIARSHRIDDYVDMAMCMARARHEEETSKGGKTSQLLKDLLYSSMDAVTDRHKEVVQSCKILCCT